MAASSSCCSRSGGRGTIRLYVDSSALVKLLIRTEPGYEDARNLWDEATEVLAAVVAYTETRAALARARRARRLPLGAFVGAKTELEHLWREVGRVEVDDRLVRLAGDLAEALAVRAYDAVHLAAALIVADVDVVFATWDTDLAKAGRAAGLSVAP